MGAKKGSGCTVSASRHASRTSGLALGMLALGLAMVTRRRKRA